MFNNLLSGTKTIGKVRIYSGIIFGLIFCALFFIMSVYFNNFYRNTWKETDGKLKNVNCIKKVTNLRNRNRKSNYSCDMNVNYKDDNNNNNVVPHTTITFNKFNENQKVSVQYDPKNTDDITINFNKKKVASLLFFISLFIGAFVYVMWLFRNNEFFQTYQGVSTIYDVFSDDE